MALVSVLMTTYNREKYITEAIESVLASSYEKLELIIVDDVSSDRTLDIARKYEAKDARVKVFVNNENLGDYLNRNKAASYARGKYIKYLDADDIIYFYGLEVMVNYMERFPEAGFGLASIVSSEKPFPIVLSPREIYLENYNGYSHFDRAPGSSIIKLEAFNKVGGFSGKRMIGDFEFWFRIARQFSMVKFPFDLYWNRTHEEQESKSTYAKLYPKLRREVYESALSDPNCPLTREEITTVMRRIKKQDIKNTVLTKLIQVKKMI